MAELVDAYVSGAYAARCGGSTPPSRTTPSMSHFGIPGWLIFFFGPAGKPPDLTTFKKLSNLRAYEMGGKQPCPTAIQITTPDRQCLHPLRRSNIFVADHANTILFRGDGDGRKTMLFNFIPAQNPFFQPK